MFGQSILRRPRSAWARRVPRLCPPYACGIALLLAASGVRADGVADFYRGKTISVLIGVNVGGGYDFEARLLARFMRAHIPGNPVLVPQNMIGAGGIKMANYLYSIAPQDGSAIGMFPQTLVAAQAVGTEGVQYDANKFAWLGSITTSPVTLAVWHTAGVQTLEDARRNEIVVAASNKGAITYTFPHMLNELLGTRFKIVSGYQGNGTMTIAMERGEVQGSPIPGTAGNRSIRPGCMTRRSRCWCRPSRNRRTSPTFPRCRSSPATRATAALFS
jgi:tripartite-type tricarboxylate transporter receptor subunit TctC